MITRRALPLAAASAVLIRPRLAAAALPVPPSNGIKARVMRNGSDIGTAIYVFERTGETLRVHVSVDLVVKLGPVPVFRYTHRNVETWQGDTLMSLEAKTDDDGTAKFCSAKRGPDGLMVTGSRDKPYVAPANALGTTYWNFHTVTSPLINTEDGRLLGVTIVSNGEKSVTLASGSAIPAKAYTMTGDLHVDLFYEPSNEWAAMTYYAKDKSQVIYQRL